jgi:hypothetical protein
VAEALKRDKLPVAVRLAIVLLTIRQ